MKLLMKRDGGHDQGLERLLLESSKVAAAQREVAQYQAWLTDPPQKNKSQLRSLWSAQWDSMLKKKKNHNNHDNKHMIRLSRQDFYQSMLLLHGCPDPHQGPHHSSPAETTSPETTTTRTTTVATTTTPPRDDTCATSTTSSTSHQQQQQYASPNDLVEASSSFSYSSLGRSIPSVTPPLPHHDDDTLQQQQHPSSTTSSSSLSSTTTSTTTHNNSGDEEGRRTPDDDSN